MSRIIRSYLNAMDRIAESLESMKPGDGRCLRCGHTASEREFQSGDPIVFGKGGHHDHRYCPHCHQSVDWFGYAVKGTDGKVRRVA